VKNCIIGLEVFREIHLKNCLIAVIIGYWFKGSWHWKGIPLEEVR
jgi:hypothetical protein